MKMRLNTFEIIISCWLVLVAIYSAQTAAANQPVDSSESLPKLEELIPPEAKVIFNSPPKDWLVLKEGRVIVCDPVTPRPDTLNKLKLREEEISAEVTKLKKGNRDAPEIEALLEEKEGLKFLPLSVEVPGREDQLEYKIEVKQVDYLIYYEDLVLKRVDAEIQQEKFNLAYELLAYLTKRLEAVNPNLPSKEELWPGIKQREYDLLFFAAKERISRQDYQSALMSLEDLFQRNPDYPLLEVNLTSTCDALITQAIQDKDYRRARFFINRLATTYPKQELVASSNNKLIAESSQSYTEAKKLWEENSRTDAIEKFRHAMTVWPKTEGLLGDYRKAFKAHQVLRMGVLDTPVDTELAKMLDRPLYFQDARHRLVDLCSVPIFDLDNVGDGRPHYSAEVLDEWLPVDLGRILVLNSKRNYAPSALLTNITAQQISQNLLVRLDPASPLYDERLDYFIDELSVPAPDKVIIKFRYIPLMGESLLGNILLLDFKKSDVDENETTEISAVNVNQNTSSSNPNRKIPGTYFSRWKQTPTSLDALTFLRPTLQPQGLEEYNVAEIQERIYPDYPALIQGLNRGEIDCIPKMDPMLIPALKKDTRYFVKPYAYPTTHFLQFNPQSPVFAVREYRKSIMLALDRKDILSKAIPGVESNQVPIGKVITAPYCSSTDLYAKTLPHPIYEPSAAMVLGFSARKKYQDKLPPLRMLVPKEPFCQPIIQAMKYHLERVQIPVTMLTEDQLTPTENDLGWDVVYRQELMYTPRNSIWPFLTLSEQANLNNLKPFPEWFRQRILEFDTASNWTVSEQVAHQLQKDLLGEVIIIPLFEIQEFFIHRNQVKNVPIKPIHPYDKVQRWSVEPFLPAS